MEKEEVVKIINSNANFKINYKDGSYNVNNGKVLIHDYGDYMNIVFNDKVQKEFFYESIITIEIHKECEKHKVKTNIDHEGVYHCQECIDDADLKRILDKRNLVAITITEYRKYKRFIYK